MKITPISSSQNALLKKIRALHQRSAREKHGQFLIEGPKLLLEALAKQVTVTDIAVSNSYWTQGLPKLDQSSLEELSVVDDKLFGDICTTSTPCGIVAVANVRRFTLDDCWKGSHTLIVVADAVQDPGNIGTMIRSALAFGATGVVLTTGTVDPYNPKVVRSAMGALFMLPVVSDVMLEPTIASLKAKGCRVLALDMDSTSTLSNTNMSGALALVFGNEGNGLAQTALELADEVICIPMADSTESLNVAICSSIVLFQCSQKRQ